jgi:hypothetical protein
MIEPTLRDKLTAVYETWLDQDDFGQRYVEVCRPEQDNGVTSVRQFLEELLQLSSGPNAHIERPAALEHPNSTFMQLLGSPLVTQPRWPSRARRIDCPSRAVPAGHPQAAVRGLRTSGPDRKRRADPCGVTNGERGR